jgi:hypothetical protein
MSVQRGLAIPASLLACAATLAACGSKTTGDSLGSNPNDQRAQALECMKDEGLTVKKVGNTSIQIGRGRRSDPRVVFYTTPRDAEAEQRAP